MRKVVYVLAGAGLLAGGAYVVATIQLDRDREAARASFEAERRVAERERPAEAAPPDAGAEPARGPSDLPRTLARLIAHPDSERPASVSTDGDVERRVYALAGFERAELGRVKGHPEAWSWLFVGPRSAAVDDLGPPGSVRDLMTGAPAEIGGHPVAGLLHHIDAGPLAGGIVVYSPPILDDHPRVQIATVSYHQRAGSLIMGPLCDLGQVPGVPGGDASAFKDACFAQVARRLRRPADELFPSPWMIRAWSTPSCDRHLAGELDGDPGWTYTCSYSAKTGRTSVAVRRAKKSD